MARPPLPLGEHGSISLASRRGVWVARRRFRGLDSVTRHIQKSGKSKTAATKHNPVRVRFSGASGWGVMRSRKAQRMMTAQSEARDT